MTKDRLELLMVAIFVIPALVCSNLMFAGVPIKPYHFAGIVVGSLVGWTFATVGNLRARREGSDDR